MALQHLRSGTADKRPTPGAMSDGQLAINTNATSTGLFFKDSAGALVKVGPVHIGTTAPNATPASGGQSGNTVGEQWLDTTGGNYVLKIWDGSAWRSEAGEFVNASGDTMTGALVMDNQQQVRFRETTANGTNFIALQAPASVASDKTITLPDVTGTVVTTGDTGSVTSTMIADSTIVDGDISASAEIAVSKLADGSARQLLQTDAAGTGVEWTSNVDVPGTLDVTSTATFDSIISASAGAAATPSITFTGDTNTGIYSPGADQVAISTNGTGRLFVDASGNAGLGGANSLGYGASGPTLQVTPSGTPGGAVTVKTGCGYGFGNVNTRIVGEDNTGNSTITFFTGNSERLRLDSSGRLGLGTSVFGSGAGQGTGTVAQINGSLYVYEGTNSGNHGGAIAFGTSGTNASYTPMAQIKGLLTNAPGTEQQGDLAFYTRPTSSAGQTLTERLRITSGGLVGIGTTSASQKLHIADSSAAFTRYESGSFDAYIGQRSSGILEIAQAQAGNITLLTNGSERARIDSSGRLLVGTSTSVQSDAKIQIQNGYLSLYDNADSSNAGYGILFHTNGGATGRRTAQIESLQESAGTSGGRLVFSTTADGASSPTERMRITNSGNVLIAKTSTSGSAVGVALEAAGAVTAVRSSDISFLANRLNSDGDLFHFYQDTILEGTISVSGSTVSYNGAHLSRWSQLPGGVERTEILRGTVLSNIDEMCGWGDEDNEQLNRMKVSDVEGDKNVSGVFQAWDDDDDTYTDDFYCAMTGDFIIRIAEGVTVQRGDLLMSAGDGTAKPQGDDIVRSKTIAKVTSTHVTCTYDDGSYCVPCVLMAC
jgi:hypothetical protein